MNGTETWQPLRDFFRRQRRPRQFRRPLILECLEERTVPTIVWSSAGLRSIADAGGPVITHVDVDLVFWGSGWNSAQSLMENVTSSVSTLMNSPFLSGLSQYRGIGTGQLLRTDLLTDSSPASAFTDGQVQNMLTAEINSGTLPPPSSDSQLLYMVIPQPGSADGSIGGEHGSVLLNGTPYHYGWTIDQGNLDQITRIYSHELTESVTDPEVNYDTAFYVPATEDEISDGQAQNYTYRIDGVLVQSSLSQVDQAYDVYDGNTQKLYLTSTDALTINGDQLVDPDDTITLDVAAGGYTIDLNGELFQFDPGKVTSITINTLTGDDTVNIEETLAGVPVTVNLGSGNDTVNLSPTAQDLSNLAGAVTINGGSGTDTLNLFDQQSNADQNYTITSSTIAATSMATVTYQSLAAVALNTSNGTDMVNVQSTPAGTAVAVNGGSGSNTLAGSAADNTWNLTGNNAGTLTSASVAGPVMFTGVQNLSGGPANDTFVFSDGAGISGNIQSGSSGAFDYSAYTSDVTVNLQSGTATGVGGGFAGIQTFTGGGGNNTLVAADVPNVWNLAGSNAGSVTGAGTVTFTGFQNLTGGAAANTFIFGDQADISGSLDGGGGGSLDYSAYSTSVIVDLQTATATGVGGGLINILNVTGGTGGGAGVYNILVGNGGNTLIGGNGRCNLLIAGPAASTLIGGDDDDILIGGTTAYDQDVAALMAIMDYWSNTADDYGTQVSNLMGNKGVPLLDPTTVTSNGGGNTLLGGPGLNLYYGNSLDTTDYDPSSGEVFVPV
jgi:hypothetical protein